LRKIFLSILFIVAASCSSTPAPAWQSSAFTQMENYIASFMEGKDNFAEIHYKRFQESLLLTSDPDIIIRAPLVKCGIESAVLRDSDCSGAMELLQMTKNPENKDYYRFITSKNKLNELPGKYRKVVQAVESCDINALNKSVSKVDKGVSTLIASSYAIRHNCYDETTLLFALSVSSENGWIRASMAYLEKLEAYYLKTGKNSEAKEIRKRIELFAD